MSRYAHVMCKHCFAASDLDDDELTNAHAGRICCYCGKLVDYSMIVHRHPDAVRCKGVHETVS